MKKLAQKNNKEKRGVTLRDVLKMKNIKRALKESSQDQLDLLRKHGVL